MFIGRDRVRMARRGVNLPAVPATLRAPMPTAMAQRCSYHAERSAFAVCMSCTKTICQECATQWDGIWHCAPCLAAKRTTVVRTKTWPGWLSLIAASAVLLFLTARAMVLCGVLLAGLR